MKILRVAAVVALLASLSAPVGAAEAARQTAIPDKPVKSDALVTPINVELEGTDSIGARLGMRLKERFNQSNLFRLMEANERKMRVLVSTRSEFPERPNVGSVYSVCWVFTERDDLLSFLLPRELATVNYEDVDALADKIVERSDGIAVKYRNLWK